MLQLKTSQTRLFDCLPRMELVIIGFLSVVVLQLFRVVTCRWLPVLWIEAIFMLVIPPLVLLVASKRSPATSGSADWLAVFLPAGAISYACLTLLIQYVSRLAGLGDATEVVMMMALQYVAWYLIIFSSLVPSYKKVGFVACCALVLFTCFMSNQPSVFVVAFFFAICAMWHLLSNYWARLNDKAIDGESKMLPVNGLAMVVSFLAAVVAGLVVWAVVPETMTMNLAGFSPFSGGDRGDQDLYARAGVGDGDMLTAGENASTSGPVESNQFIEDDKPSMYDVNVEKNENATEVKKRMTRSVSIRAQALCIEEVIKSEQAGRSFRTARMSSSRKVPKLKNRISKALFFVEGSVPARFSIDCFHHFDGWDWSKVDLDVKDLPRTQISLGQESGLPWYKTGFPRTSYLTTSRAHKIKILRLETNSLLSPPMLHAWHIHRVDKPGFFKFSEQGTVLMDGKFIPSHTVIDTISDVPNFHVLANQRDCQMARQESPFSQIPDNQTKSRIKELVNGWTQEHTQGWSQVEAIINRLRTDFTHDPTRVASDDHGDSVESFLEQQGGPAYQFASVATQMLRAAGYKARLKRGFLIQSKDYSRVSGQSIVTSDNLHMWPEVCLDGWHWIPVEPTPGFPIPYNHLTWWQWSQGKAVACVSLIKQHPVTSLLAFLVLGCLYRFRWEWIAGLSWIVWNFVFQLFPSRRLKATRKLIDRRFWAAGSPRPEFTAISDWFSQPDPEASRSFCHFWQIENFSLAQKSSLQREKVSLACRQIVGNLSLRRIKSHIKTELSQ